MKAEAGWWLWAENPLQPGTLTLLYDKPLPPASPEPLPMAVRQEQQRQILTLQPVAALSFGEAAAPTVNGSTIKK
jgi:hypothetical protein